MQRPWVAIQRNPRSGSGSRSAVLRELIGHLRRVGLRPRLFSRRERLQQHLADPGRRNGLVCIVAAGGDGTVGDVINRFPGVPVAILPLGTENLLARYLGITRSGRFVAEMIAAGKTRLIDACMAGERRFVLMASCGFDADVLHRLDARRSGHITKRSYLQPICESLRKYEYPELRMYMDDAQTPLTGRLAVIMNLPVYALGLPVARSARADDGLLDVRIFQRHSAFQMIRYFTMVARGRHEQLSDVVCVQARRIRIESDRPVPVQVDGDPAGSTPIEIGIVPVAVELFIPANDGNNPC